MCIIDVFNAIKSHPMCATFAQHASKTPFRGMPHSYKGSINNYNW